jgi:hypothetical protein
MKQINISNQKFGNLTAIRPDPENGRFWLFKCDCGTVKYIRRSNVLYGFTIGCGCMLSDAGLRNRVSRMTTKMVGKKFNKLTVKEYAYRKDNSFYWKCICDCGNETVASSNCLRFGKIKSCGCFLLTKHEPGFSGLKRIYLIYKQSAKQRNLTFNLTIDKFKKITSQNCSYCGIPPSEISDHSKNHKNGTVNDYTAYKFNGIDRIDSKKGYDEENVTPCCKRCNYVKHTSTVEELKNHVIKIYEHLK